MKPKDFEVIYKFTVASTVPFPNTLNWNAEPIGELIRCKDCKHARKCYGDVVWASKGGGYIYNPLGSDGFCSIAERKEE